MPKEIVRNANPELNRLDDGTTRHVEVRWARDQFVQVATVTPEKPGWTEPVLGTFVDLDRRGINEAIRALRRARDQAYGRDE